MNGCTDSEMITDCVSVEFTSQVFLTKKKMTKNPILSTCGAVNIMSRSNTLSVYCLEMMSSRSSITLSHLLKTFFTTLTMTTG